MRNRGQAARGVFPPAQIAEVKAVACELPSESGVPLSRYSSSEVAREAVNRGIVVEISGTTVWRWLAEDAIRPWNYRSWIFPRDPQFALKAGRVLDLYAVLSELLCGVRVTDSACVAGSGSTRSP